jgi:hypothetical protein
MPSKKSVAYRTSAIIEFNGASYISGARKPLILLAVAAPRHRFAGSIEAEKPVCRPQKPV